GGTRSRTINLVARELRHEARCDRDDEDGHEASEREPARPIGAESLESPAMPWVGAFLRERHRPREGFLEEALRRAVRRRVRHPPGQDRADAAPGQLVCHRIPLSVVVHAEMRSIAASLRSVRSSASSEARSAAVPYRIRDLTVPTGIPSDSAISVCDGSKWCW